MKKSQEYELRKYVGDPSALCGIRDILFNDGVARGTRAFEVNNGSGLQLTVVADRGLDIPYCSYKGVNVSLLQKVGLRSPYLYTEDMFKGFLKQFYGGLMTTCGITYAGGAAEDGDRMLGLHGNFDNTPADHVTAERTFEGDDVVLKIAGEIHQSEVFRENMMMRRTLTIDTERSRIRVRDEAKNLGFATEPLMLIYHINFGYPMLDAGAMVYTNAKEVEPRDDFAASMLDIYDQMEAPGISRDEQCYFHTGQPEQAFAMLHNPKLGIAAIIEYDSAKFPILCEWKCMRAGDYALGLEPTTSGVKSRAEARSEGTLTFLEPDETRVFEFSIELTDDEKRIGEFIARARRH